MPRPTAKKQVKSRSTAIKNVITVKNAIGESDTTAQLVIKNRIKYTPKVSVIIPIYNNEDYLAQCLDSVINQTLKEIEIICIDDGSTDNSLSILKKYAKDDNRITVLQQENLHAGIARNAGLSIARGEYLSFLDSDDFFEPNMLEEMYSAAKLNKLDVAICRCKIFDVVTKKIDTEKFNYTLHDEYFPARIVSGQEIKQKVFQVVQGFPWDKLFKRSFINKMGLRFQGTTNTNDAYFVFTSMCLAKRISYVSKKLVCKRVNNVTSLTSNRAKNPACYVTAINGIRQTLKEYGVYDAFLASLWQWAAELTVVQLNRLPMDAKLSLYSTLHKSFKEWNECDTSQMSVRQRYAFDYIKKNAKFPEITVAYATNKKFFDLCLVSVASMLKNSAFENINVIVLHTELDDSDKNKLEQLKRIKNFTCTFTTVDGNIFKDFPLVWTTMETWYRCLLADMFPQYDKILYLDGDTIVRKPLLKIWETKLGNNLIAAVEDVSNSKDHAKEQKLKDKFYFNAGVLLLNTKQWRKESTCKKIFKYVQNNEVFQADQGTLNKIADSKKVQLSPEYNYMEVWWRENTCQYSDKYMKIYNAKDPTIIHFTGMKPTNDKCKHSFRKEFLQYSSLVPCLNKPKPQPQPIPMPKYKKSTLSLRLFGFIPLIKMEVEQ